MINRYIIINYLKRIKNIIHIRIYIKLINLLIQVINRFNLKNILINYLKIYIKKL